jgi:hypothetical protein
VKFSNPLVLPRKEENKILFSKVEQVLDHTYCKRGRGRISLRERGFSDFEIEERRKSQNRVYAKKYRDKLRERRTTESAQEEDQYKKFNLKICQVNLTRIDV